MLRSSRGSGNDTLSSRIVRGSTVASKSFAEPIETLIDDNFRCARAGGHQHGIRTVKPRGVEVGRAVD